MRVVELGTFLLPFRLSLPDLLTGGRDQLKTALQDEFSEFAAPPPLRSSGLVLDFHRSIGARQMESMVFEGAVDVDGLGVVNLYISALSVGFVITSLDVADGESVDLDKDGDSAFKQRESALTDVVSPLVTEWCRRVGRATPPSWMQQPPKSTMVSGQLLWWHRVAIDPAPGSEFAAARWFGVEAKLGPDLHCSVGSGFTNIHGDPGPLLEHILEGIMIATEEWLIVDEAQRVLADHLTRLSRIPDGDLITVNSQYGEILTLTEEVTLRKLMLSEEQRYLANTRTRIKDAATECWQIAEQVAELDGRIAALRDIFALHRERIVNDRDERRNALVFIITAIALIQSVLVWYDFLTEPNNQISQDPRPLLAGTTLGITFAVALGVLWRQVRERRRRARSGLRRRTGLLAAAIPAPRADGGPATASGIGTGVPARQGDDGP